MNVPACSIDGILAARAPRAVIFRRGPRDLTQQLLWDLDTDAVEAGQWLRARVYTRRCDLSPDGRQLVGFYGNWSASRLARASREHALERPHAAQSWTAISFAPYFTATALWFQGHTWGGGGHWVADDHVELVGIPADAAAIAPRQPLRVEPCAHVGPHRWEGVWHERLRARGWRVVGVDATERAAAWEKDAPGGRLLYRCAVAEGAETWTLLDARGQVAREWRSRHGRPGLFDFDAGGRLVYAEDGCLWAWRDWPAAAPVRIADLRANTFAPVVAPYDRARP